MNRLIARIAIQDDAAMAELYDRSSRLVYSLCRRIVQDEEGAETAALDTYMQVWRRASSFDPDRGSAEAWLLTIARTRSLDERRRQVAIRRGDSLESAADLPDESPSPATQSSRKETDSLVRNALNRVSNEEKEVLDFAYFAGMSHREIASHITAPIGTVKSRIRSGVGKLRHILHPLERGLGS